MPYGQNWINSSNNGMFKPLQIGTVTVGNIINGYFDRPLYKIKGVFPNFNETRSMPLRPWELIEINWKDFAQYVGKLQGYGWTFNPQLSAAYNAAKDQLTNLQSQLADQQSQLTAAQKTQTEANDQLEEANTLLAAVPNKLDVQTGLQDVSEENITEAPLLTEFTDNSGYPLTTSLLQAKVNNLKAKADEANSIVTTIQNEVNSLQTQITNLENEIAGMNVPEDELGLTDAFMHAIYTEFLKRFWRYNVGQTDPEDWFLLLNSFFGNYLPMMYKAAKVIADSTDFSTTQWQQGGSNVGGTTQQQSSSDGIQTSDGKTRSQDGQVAAVAQTPQNRLNLNARNVDYANQVNSGSNNQQAGAETLGATKDNEQSTTTQSTASTNTGNQWQLDPLSVWNKVLVENGLFFDLWDKALDYGLFDLVQ